MKLSVLVPMVPGEACRDRAWNWVSLRITQTLGDVEIVTAEPDGADNPGVFNFAQGVNRAAERANGDVFLILEGDTAFDAVPTLLAAEKVAAGDWAWSLTTLYRKLTQTATERILLLEPSTRLSVDASESDWVGTTHFAGGLLVPREAFKAIGGADERHRGWGWWDISFAAALSTLWGEAVRHRGTAYHFWHPQPLNETFGQPHNDEQRELFYRYEAAEGDKAAMTALLAERRSDAYDPVAL